MAPSATVTQSMSAKVKRPVPPGIQTNGINSSTSSPSPSMSAGRLPNATPRNTSGSAASNGVSNGNSGPRSASRIRRDTPAQLLGRGQRNSSVGLRSASLLGESTMVPAGPQPYILTDEYILSKHRGSPPSLVIHLHQNHFRFDQQEGSFTYKSPMRMIIEHLRQRTVPHDLLEFMPDVPFYDGCMIVQLYDHKSIAPQQGHERSSSSESKATPFSIHNANPWLTPSSYVPFPSQSATGEKSKKGSEADGPSKTAEEKDKENMPAPTLPGDSRQKGLTTSKEPKVITIVLHPTALSHHMDLALKATETRASSDDRRGSRSDINGGPLSATVPPTPVAGAPPTPQLAMPPPAKRQKRAKTELDSNNIYAVESQITAVRTAELNLEPVSSAAECAALIKSLAHPMHDEKPPAPKSRKRTVAEMAADEALAADQERFMLVLDDRTSNTSVSGGANPTNGEGPTGGVGFEPRFERFKTLENIRALLDENKRIEKQRREEADKKQKAEAERNKLEENTKRQMEEKNRAQAQQLQLQQAETRRRMAQQAAQTHQGISGQTQGPHAHPQTNGMNSQPQRFHQSVSQGQISSPIVRNGTPHSHSSPTVNNMGNVPMQHSTSSMGGSPPRPGSVVHQNHHPMRAPTPQGMAPQRSQQSHAGTPRMQASSTPNMQATPLNRQLSQTPRLGQGSPLQGTMGQMVPGQVPNVQQPMQLTPQQLHIYQQQKMAQMMRNGQGMVGTGQQLTQQQMQILQQQQAMRVQQQQQQLAGQQPNAALAQYAASMAQMGQMGQMNQMGQMGRPTSQMPPNMNQNMMNAMGNRQLNPQQIQQFQQMQLAQQQQQQQAAQIAQQQQLQQQQQQQQQQQPDRQTMIQQQIHSLANQLYNQQRNNLAPQYPGGIPPDVDMQLRSRCAQTARAQFEANYRARQQQQMAQAQRMNGMQNGGGM